MSLQGFNRTSVELKRFDLNKPIEIIPGFNRTSVELKLIIYKIIKRVCSFVLIAPVWN